MQFTLKIIDFLFLNVESTLSISIVNFASQVNDQCLLEYKKLTSKAD